MTTAKAGDTIRMHYTGTLKDGTVFDSSQGRDPLEFTLGSGMIIPGLDSAIAGMGLGDTKVVNIPPELAYGAVQDGARQTIELKNIPADVPLEMGAQLQMQSPDGQILVVTVVDLNDKTVTLDANHQLAGKDLTFDIEIVGIDAA